MNKIIKSFICLLLAFLPLAQSVSAATISPDDKYHENSENNFTGASRRVAATPFLQNGAGASHSGNYSNDETYYLVEPYYGDDGHYYDEAEPVYIDVLSKIQLNAGLQGEFESLDVHLNLDDRLVFSGKPEDIVSITYPTGTISSDIPQDVLTYNPDDNSIDLHFEGTKYVTTSGEIGARLRFHISPTVTGESNIVPFQQTSVLTAKNAKTGETNAYTSGVSGAFSRETVSTGEKIVENLTNNSGKNYIGDKLQYTINYSNTQTSSALTGVNMVDEIPKGFSYDTSSLKIYNVSSSGIEKDVTDTIQVNDNSPELIDLDLGTYSKSTGFKITYSGVINEQVVENKINNIAKITATSVGLSATGTLECESLIEVEPTQPNNATVNVRYVDENNNPIHDVLTISGKVGEDYDVSGSEYKLEIEGYTFKEVQGDVSGQFTEQAQTVTYIYTKNPVSGGDVTVKYVDTEGNEISDEVVKSGSIGENYNTEQKNIDGYTFKEVQGDVSGQFTEQAQTVTYIYEKRGQEINGSKPVIIHYQDEAGKTISTDIQHMGNLNTAYHLEQNDYKNIKGYKFKELQGDAEGVYTTEVQEVTLIYTKVNETVSEENSSTSKETGSKKEQLASTPTSIPQHDNTSNSNPKNLPTTGEKATCGLSFVLGVLLFVTGVFIAIFTFKKNKKSQNAR